MLSVKATKAGVVCLVSIALMAAVLGCGGGVGGTAVDLAKDMPEGALSYIYWDSQALASDNDLHPLRDKWKAANEAWLAQFAIESETVQHFSQFAMQQSTESQLWQFSLYGNNTLIVRGDFDRKQIRDRLSSQGRHKGDWKKIEVWEDTIAGSWLAMADRSLVGGDAGHVRASIDVIEGDGPSLYSSPDIRDILNELPSGIMVNCHRYGGEPPYAGLLSSGASFRKKNSSTLKVNLSYKFSSPDSAGNALEAIRDAIDLGYSMVEARQDGRFIHVKAEVEIDDLARQ